MFVAEDIVIPVGFTAARARLANLTRGGWLDGASETAYGDGFLRVGPLGGRLGVSKLVRVHSQELADREGRAVLAMRWEATGHGGGLFPALDADLTLAPAGEDATRLALAGAYRPPLAAVGAGLNRAILHRVAEATIRSLARRLGSALVEPALAAEAARQPMSALRPWPAGPGAPG